MSDLEAIDRALWEAERDWQAPIVNIQMTPPMKMRLLASGKWEWALPEPHKLTLFGITVLIDPSMSPNEVKLVADCGCVVKLINLG